jgi:hypothetical protein
MESETTSSGFNKVGSQINVFDVNYAKSYFIMDQEKEKKIHKKYPHRQSKEIAPTLRRFPHRLNCHPYVSKRYPHSPSPYLSPPPFTLRTTSTMVHGRLFTEAKLKMFNVDPCTVWTMRTSTATQGFSHYFVQEQKTRRKRSFCSPV